MDKLIEGHTDRQKGKTVRRTDRMEDKETERLTVDCTPRIVKSHMECLGHVYLPGQCLGGVYHPSVTMGAPLRAPKQAEIRPKEPCFPLSML